MKRGLQRQQAIRDLPDIHLCQNPRERTCDVQVKKCGFDKLRQGYWSGCRGQGHVIGNASTSQVTAAGRPALGFRYGQVGLLAHRLV